MSLTNQATVVKKKKIHVIFGGSFNTDIRGGKYQ